MKPATKMSAKPPSKPSNPVIDGMTMQKAKTKSKIHQRLLMRRWLFFMLKGSTLAGIGSRAEGITGGLEFSGKGMPQLPQNFASGLSGDPQCLQ